MCVKIGSLLDAIWYGQNKCCCCCFWHISNSLCFVFSWCFFSSSSVILSHVIFASFAFEIWLFVFVCFEKVSVFFIIWLVDFVEQVVLDRALLTQIIKLKLVKRNIHLKKSQEQKSINCFDQFLYWNFLRQAAFSSTTTAATTAKALITTQDKNV